jgi:glycerophosphoryl diester phosphodiesterase
VEEFLDYVQDKDIIVNWELKEYPLELGEEWAYGTIDRLIELIDRYGMAERSMINSFSERDLEYVADKWPGRFAIHGYLHYKHPKDFADKELASFCHWVAIWNKTPEHPAGFECDYAEAAAYDILPCILVQDVQEQYEQALALGCRMFTSDDPQTALGILRRLRVR